MDNELAERFPVGSVYEPPDVFRPSGTVVLAHAEAGVYIGTLDRERGVSRKHSFLRWQDISKKVSART